MRNYDAWLERRDGGRGEGERVEEVNGKGAKKLARQEVGAHCQRSHVKWSLNSLW